MGEPQTDFFFLGRQVSIKAKNRNGQWFWSYCIDSGKEEFLEGFGLWSYRAAVDEAGMLARNEIRDFPKPFWRLKR